MKSTESYKSPSRAFEKSNFKAGFRVCDKKMASQRTFADPTFKISALLILLSYIYKYLLIKATNIIHLPLTKQIYRNPRKQKTKKQKFCEATN